VRRAPGGLAPARAAGESEPEYLEPLPGAKKRQVALVLGFGLVGVLLMQFGEPAYLRYIDQKPLCDTATWIFNTLLALAYPAFLVMGVYLLWLAFRIHKTGQWPPAGTRVAHRTPLHRGKRARRYFWRSLIIGGVTLVFGAVHLAWFLQVREEWIDKACHERRPARPGKTKPLALSISPKWWARDRARTANLMRSPARRLASCRSMTGLRRSRSCPPAGCRFSSSSTARATSASEDSTWPTSPS